MNEELRDRFRSVARAVYLVAILLVVGPLLDLVASVWPLSPTSVAWRFAATGLLSKALLVPLLGSLAAVVAALVLEHRRFLRLLSYANAGIAILLIGATIEFVLDTVQLRSGIAPEVTSEYDVAAVRAVVNLVLVGAALGGLGISGFRASRRTDRKRK
ncbi:MAG: hypothetical protein IIB36_09680 [Gemmatimonadetes bacterium]|nr:hypothetical protein [Gemmatimonadota bacterium]